jgi:hypothetical protein
VAKAATANTASHPARTSSSSNAVRTLKPVILTSPIRIPKIRPNSAATAYSTTAMIVTSLAFGCGGATNTDSSTALSGNRIVGRFT